MLTQLNYLTANKMSYEKEITCPYFKTKTNSIEQGPSCEAYSQSHNWSKLSGTFK